jgi:hypothetical protein
MNRRNFFNELGWRVIKWSPMLGLLGFRFHAYTNGILPMPGYEGWSGWVTFCGRLVGFVR